MKKRYYILIAIISYLIFTLSNIPAAKIVSLLKQNKALPATLYGVEGSLWEGRAAKIIIRNAPETSNLQWSINPAYLLLAQVSGSLKASIMEQNVVSQFSLGPTGELSISDLRARIDAPDMQSLLNIPLGELGGIFNIDIESVNNIKDPIPQITGDIKWSAAKLTLAETVDLGHILVQIAPDKSTGLIANITNTKGDVSLNGKINVTHKKTYSMDLSITPSEQASKDLKQSLGLFARRQSDGSYQIKRKGSLREFGI